MAKVAFPARCAVAVVCGEHLVSQVYPASVPVEVFIDNIVELLNDELKRRGLAGLESGIGYELHKANGVRLDVTKTLDELGVEDGATLVLAPAVEGDSFEPQYESLSTGLARVGRTTVRAGHRGHRGPHRAGDPGDDLGRGAGAGSARPHRQRLDAAQHRDRCARPAGRRLAPRSWHGGGRSGPI